MASSSTKRRNSEKRKEKSRDAARNRRGKESEVFMQLSQSLPLMENMAGQLDKATVMRLAISFLKIGKIMEEKRQKARDDEEKNDQVSELKVTRQYAKALEGFVLIISREGDLIFISENVSKYLGIQQIELIGQSIFEFSHPCDHDEIRDMLAVRPHTGSLSGADDRLFFMRMKCTLTSRGKNVNLKSATYKVIKCTGHMIAPKNVRKTFERESKENDSTGNLPYLLAVGEPIPHPQKIEQPLDSGTFNSRHSMDMKFTDCDERILDLIGYNSQELIDQSLYDYHHALDSDILEKAYKDLFAKGQTMTGQYRFLAKNGGYVWAITQGTIIYNSRTQKPQFVVCVHYVLSAVEKKELVLSEVQRRVVPDRMFIPLTVELSTEAVFEDKTKDMEEDFYFPPGFKKSNDLLEDLTHLAPSTGDTCVPLEFPTINRADLGFHSPSSYGDYVEMEKEDPVTKDINLTSFKEEPDVTKRHVCRRDPHSEYSSRSTTPASKSPMICPSPEDYQTVGSAIDVQLMDRFFTTMDTSEAANAAENEMAYMEERAPYIPMNAEEDLNLLAPSQEVLFSVHADFSPGLYGRTEDVFSSDDKTFEEASPSRQSLRDMLCGSTTVASIERAPDTMLLQMKRPLDMNSLEKGPPAAKQPKADQKESNDKAMNKSVLLNLLLTGEDRDHGYSVRNPLSRRLPNMEEHLKDKDSRNEMTIEHHLLPKITQQDCDVNAPVQNLLLHGKDLLHALDEKMPSTPHPRIRHTIC